MTTLKIEDELYRTCVPGDDPKRWFCMYVSTESSPPGITVDRNRESNASLNRLGGVRLKHRRSSLDDCLPMGGPMRVTRAFVGSVGAGLCLVAAAVTVLFVLSAVVAVRGWPGIDPENDVPRVTLADALARVLGRRRRPAARPVAVAASPARRGADRPRRRSRPAVTTTGARRRAAVARRARRQTTLPPARTPGPAPAPGAAGSASRRSFPGDPAAPQDAGRPVAETIRDTGEAVGGVTDPVAPGSGQAVTQVTDAVADTVDGDGQGRRDRRPRATSGGAVEKTTDTVGTLLGGS